MQKGQAPDSEDEDDFDDTFGFPLVSSVSDDDAKEQGGEEGGRVSGDRQQQKERQKKPFFFPPLWLARRTFIADLLKEEGVGSVCPLPLRLPRGTDPEKSQVADLGCGSGALTSLLALPVYHLDDFPPPLSSLAPISDPTPFQQAKLDVLSSLPSTPLQERELRLRRLVGVDLSGEACAAAGRSCGEGDAAKDEDVGNSTRWEELKVEVWEGGVEVRNERLEGIEAIVLTEVRLLALNLYSYNTDVSH
jgi:hypothetical protein